MDVSRRKFGSRYFVKELLGKDKNLYLSLGGGGVIAPFVLNFGSRWDRSPSSPQLVPPEVELLQND